MGKRSGIPHTDAELEALSADEMLAEIERCRARLRTDVSAKIAKQWHKRIHWLETSLTSRT